MAPNYRLVALHTKSLIPQAECIVLQHPSVHVREGMAQLPTLKRLYLRHGPIRQFSFVAGPPAAGRDSYISGCSSSGYGSSEMSSGRRIDRVSTTVCSTT